MTDVIDYESFEVGAEIPEREFSVKLVEEVMYCGAGLDFTGVHWNERVANSVGLPHAIAHGSLTVAKALILLHDWTDDPTAVVHYEARFESPVLIPDDGRGAVFRVAGVIEEKLLGSRVLVVLTVTSEDDRVLARVRCVVQLPSDTIEPGLSPLDSRGCERSLAP